MENLFKETDSLPLTFRYIELITKKNLKEKNTNTIYYISCKKYQTKFYVRQNPCKSLVRML